MERRVLLPPVILVDPGGPSPSLPAELKRAFRVAGTDQATEGAEGVGNRYELLVPSGALIVELVEADREGGHQTEVHTGRDGHVVCREGGQHALKLPQAIYSQVCASRNISLPFIMLREI